MPWSLCTTFSSPWANLPSFIKRAIAGFWCNGPGEIIHTRKYTHMKAYGHINTSFAIWSTLDFPRSRLIMWPSTISNFSCSAMFAATSDTLTWSGVWTSVETRNHLRFFGWTTCACVVWDRHFSEQHHQYVQQQFHDPFSGAVSCPNLDCFLRVRLV